jgi:hypothetical protein
LHENNKQYPKNQYAFKFLINHIKDIPSL